MPSPAAPASSSTSSSPSTRLAISVTSAPGSPKAVAPPRSTTTTTAIRATPSASSASTLSSTFASTLSLTSPSNRPTPGTDGSIDVTHRADLSDEEKQHYVFQVSRAKKVFKQFDLDRDKFLSPEEFRKGIRDFLGLSNDSSLSDAAAPDGHDSTVSERAIEALWKETDLNEDGKISLPEFLYRFSNVQDRSLLERPPAKQSLILQTPRRPPPSGTKITVEVMRDVLDAVYDGTRLRYKGVDLSKQEQVSSSVLKKILTQVLQCEKEQAKDQKRDMEPWAAHIFNLGGLTQKDADKLFHHLDTKKSGRVDLGPIFEQAKLKPSTRSRSKKKKSNYVLDTVKEEHLYDWLNERVLLSLQPDHKCQPALPHWGDVDRQKRALVSSGYKTHIFLSERTRILSIVKGDHEFFIFLTFRTEYTSKARTEWLWYARVHLNGDEMVDKIEVKEKKRWVDAEVVFLAPDPLFADWQQFVANYQHEEELSIPPLV